MKCPTCGENTPDAWKQLVTAFRPGEPASMVSSSETLHQVARFALEAPRGHSIHFDRMYCANSSCNQLVIRGHDTHPRARYPPFEKTETWLVHPRHSHRSVDPLVPADMARDFGEAAAILDLSHRMSAVLARRILADVLAKHAGCTQFSLAKQIDQFIADTNRPRQLRENLHHLREMADFSAHTQTDDQLETLDIDRDEAEWTLEIIQRLFDYLIVAPEQDRKLREGMEARIAKADRKPIKPLPPDPELPLEEDDGEATDREDAEGS